MIINERYPFLTRDGKLQEWKLYLKNPHSRLLPQSKIDEYSNLTEEYMKRVRFLNHREDIPLAEILSMIEKELRTSNLQYFEVIRIRDKYAMKGQFADFALFLQTYEGSGLRTISSGNLRIPTSPSKHVSSYVET